jgi:diketogulonate reductase-like aldo/keto reductase
MSSIELKSGHAMPLLGLGTWNLRGVQCAQVVQLALEMGYRHIDTAHMYENQVEVGQGLRASGVERGEIFVTTKIWRDSLAYDEVLAQFAACLEMLEMDYVDLLLIHWPNEAVPLAETLRAFDEIAATGQARSIGVSNFGAALVDQALELATAPIVANQVELHVGNIDAALWRHCRDREVAITAYRPLAKGDAADDATLETIGEKRGKSAAQVALRWLVQKGIIAIPKASSEAHLRANMDIFAWELETAEMERLDRL